MALPRVGQGNEETGRPGLMERVGMRYLGLTKRVAPWRISQIQAEEPTHTVSNEKHYDEYGFSVSDNQFAHGIGIYEQNFNEKRERRLKR